METEAGKPMTITVIQKRPNTCVAISTVDETQYVGFSKVCWPDTWDSRTGLFVALGKAAADMFEIKVPKSGRMDVYLLSDPRVVETRGERVLRELREHLASLYDEQAQVEPVVPSIDSSGPHSPFEVQSPGTAIRFGDGNTTVTDRPMEGLIDDTGLPSRTEHMPDHRTMEEKQDDRRRY